MRMKRHLAEPGRPFRHKWRKKAANVSIDAEILAAAKAQKINLSAVLEEELRKRVQQDRIRQWQKENRAAIESHNRYIAKNGTLSEHILDLDDPSV